MYIYVHISIYISLSPCLFGFFGCCCVQVCAIHIVCMDTYSTYMYNHVYYICIYIYVYSTHVGTQPQEMLATCFATYGIGE